MSAELLYSEILDEFKTKTNEDEQIALLKKHDHQRFRDFLQCVFHPGIKFDVDIPIYRPAQEPAGLNFTYLDIEMGRIYIFVVGHPKRSPDLTAQKQKSILKSVLEALNKDEADYLVRMLKKDLEIPTLTKKLVKKTFPDLDLG
jgi:hypothetical protein